MATKVRTATTKPVEVTLGRVTGTGIGAEGQYRLRIVNTYDWGDVIDITLTGAEAAALITGGSVPATARFVTTEEA
jgi:molybdopterin biosynthesis enzyme